MSAEADFQQFFSASIVPLWFYSALPLFTARAAHAAPVVDENFDSPESMSQWQPTKPSQLPPRPVEPVIHVETAASGRFAI